MFLSDHARKLAEEEAGSEMIDATMVESDRYLQMACKAAEQASPYYHPKVSGGAAEGEVLAYVARLPTPIENSEQWAAESQPPGCKRTQ